MPPEFFISALVTLLVVVDPLGLVPIFASLTARLPVAARRRVAMRASLTAFMILCGAALVGDWLLRQLGIGLPAFRIAGGLLLFSIASEMVFGVRIVREAQTAEAAIEEDVRNIAAFPLGIPLMAGPGAITAVILLAGRAAGDPVRLAGLIAVIAVVVLACLIAFLLGTRIARLLGVAGNVVLERLLGVILAALGAVRDRWRKSGLELKHACGSDPIIQIFTERHGCRRILLDHSSGLRLTVNFPCNRHASEKQGRGSAVQHCFVSCLDWSHAFGWCSFTHTWRAYAFASVDVRSEGGPQSFGDTARVRSGIPRLPISNAKPRAN